jgi:hypothetical protein
MNYYGSFHRKYVRDDDPGPFMSLIQSLSFACHNMGAVSDGPRSLTVRTPLGIVTVMRVKDMEFVTVFSGIGALQILLSSAEDESYGIDLVITDTCQVGDVIKIITIPGAFFSDTYVYADYDSWVETCPFIYTLDHKSFITVVSGGKKYQNVIKNRDDWHNNTFNDLIDLGYGQGIATYHNSINIPGSEKVTFSFSPVTYGSAFSHIGRYIDHSKRLYIPILGRGVEFTEAYPKLAGCTGYPFGKKPFTITKDGITSWGEVVKPSGSVALPSYLTMAIYWPFIPYMHEIPYLNLRSQYRVDQGGANFPIQTSLRFIDSIYNYSIYRSGSAGEPIRDDVALIDYPEVVSTHSSGGTLDPSHGIVSGTLNTTNTQDQSITSAIKKNATIGTVGGMKDLFVETVISALLKFDYDDVENISRDTDFIANYYDSGWVPDGSWPCGKPREDTTMTDLDIKRKWTNSIEGSQSLKVGDIIIDSGEIALNYSGEVSSVISHNGMTTWNRECNPCTTLYTTIDVLYPSESQAIHPRDGATREPCDCPFSYDPNFINGGETYRPIGSSPDIWPGVWNAAGWSLSSPVEFVDGVFVTLSTTPGKLDLINGEYFYTAPTVDELDKDALQVCKFAGLVYLYCRRWNPVRRRVEVYLAATSDFQITNPYVGGYAYHTCSTWAGIYNYQNWYYCTGLPVYAPPGMLGYNSCAFLGYPSIEDTRTEYMLKRGCCPPLPI